jgi:hypothetical protein
LSHEPLEQAAQSVQQRLRNARARIQVRQKVTLEIPGYGGLFGQYRLLDFHETRAVGAEVEASGVEGDTEKTLYLAAHHLLAASIGTEAHIDGQVHDIGLPLGRELAIYLGLDECENDRQAVFVIFRRAMDVAEQFEALQLQKAYADREADKSVVGESEAAGE